MKIVVTGALGHIGSKLIRYLPNMVSGVEIVMIDNLLTQRFASLFNLPENGNYSFYQEDILTSDLTSRFDGADAVIHLAAITDAAGSVNKPGQVEQTNFEGTVRVADACVQTGAALLSLSTTSVYGKQADLVDETCGDKDLLPQSPYAESKLRAERYLSKLGKEKGLRFNTLRFGTIFGPSPGMRFHTAVNKFIWQANLGLPITIWRTALNQKRPYLDLNDAVASLGFLVREGIYNNEVFNVLTLNATPKDITDAISEFSGALNIEFVDSEIMNQLSYEVDRKKFESLGFEFKGELSKGIGSTFELLKGIQV